MPTAIPYDPSLVLGNIVPQAALTNLIEISKAQAPIDAAQDSLASLISVRRGLDMTVQQLLNLNVDATEVVKEIDALNAQIADAGKGYAKAWVDNVAQIKALKSKQLAVNESYESPLDYNRSQIKKMPLSSDSLKLEAQYFSFDENKQSAKNTIASIKGFINNSTSELGEDLSEAASAAVSTQVSSQLENHEVAGTLVISVSCTHKDAMLLAPLIIDVDKAIRVWNKIFSDDADKLKVDSVADLRKVARESGTAAEKSINIISGATTGSCFIGMVHVLRTESSQSSQNMVSVAESMQAQFQVGGWFASEKGGFGVDSSFANDIKNMLSTQNITSHVSLVAIGAIPSIKSNQVKVAVKEFANFDPATMMTNLATLANATTADKTSVAQSATAAQTGAQMLAIQGSTVSNVMLGLAEIDDGQNKMLDINSMMTAFEDYVDRAAQGNVGVPINYYLKPITRSELAQMWVSKYYPNKYLSIAGDDSGPAASGSGQAAASTTAQAA